jgi:hypothetical protein
MWRQAFWLAAGLTPARNARFRRDLSPAGMLFFSHALLCANPNHMKIAGFLLLLSGLFLVLSALALLRSASPQALFVLLGVAVELLGIAMAFRSHLPPKERRR